MKKSKVLITLVAAGCFAGALTASAQWVIDTVDEQNIITFETDVADVFVANAGIEGNHNLCESYAWEISTLNTNRGAGFITMAASYRQQWFTPPGKISGAPTPMLDDSDGDGTNTSGQIGFNQIGTDLGAGASGNHAFQLAQDNDYAVNGYYLRIKNNTGKTIEDWKLDTKIYFGETDSNINDFSVLVCSYAINDGTDPSTNYMSFTTFGTPPVVSSGDVITTLAGTLSETIETAGVTNGGFIVLQFSDVGGRGSDIYLDDIEVTAVKPPPAGTFMSIH